MYVLLLFTFLCSNSRITQPQFIGINDTNSQGLFTFQIDRYNRVKPTLEIYTFAPDITDKANPYKVCRVLEQTYQTAVRTS